MSSARHSQPGAIAAGYSIEALLVSFPVACFTLALVTDIIYWRTSYLMWSHFSSWLLLAGLLVGAAAIIARLIGIFSRAEHRDVRTPDQFPASAPARH